MATWKIEPTYKKSVVEVMELYKEGVGTIKNELVWRWGEFTLETEDDTPPNISEGVDIFDCGYELSDWSTDDGCSEDYDLDDIDDEEREKIEEFLEENSWLDLDGHDGWSFSESYMYIQCPVSVEMIEE
jgi:hypothetical protein